MDLLVSCLWGLVLLASFAGWGRWSTALLRVRSEAHLGLELVWGYAVTLALGGWLCWLGVAVRPVLAACVGLGVAGLLLRSRRPCLLQGGTSPVRLIAVATFASGMLALTFAIGLFDGRYQPEDDLTTYFLHARQIVETGTLEEPFSFRRMASYGGQSFLHALLLVASPVERLNLVDRGVARVGAGIALLAAALDPRTRSLAAACLVAYVVGIHEDLRFNTSSVFTGVLAFVGLWMTLEACRQRPERIVANGVLTGLAAAATLALRVNYAVACGLILLFEHASRLRETRERRQLSELSIAAACATVALGGWALLQLRASGTPAYPLFRGFANPDWDAVFAVRSLGEFTDALSKFIGTPQLQFWGCLCVFALFLPRRSREEASLRALAGGALLAALAHFALLGHAIRVDMLRYTLGFMLPPTLFASLRAASLLGKLPGASALRSYGPGIAAAIVLAVLCFLPPTSEPSLRLQRLQALRWSIVRESDRESLVSQLAQLQNSAPAGAKLLVMLETPFLLDLRRNAIASLDLPGGVSPPPGLAQIQSPAGVAAYLVDHGYTWLGVVLPARTAGLYGEERWIRMASGSRMDWYDADSDAVPWQVMGRTITRFFRTLDELTRHCVLTHSYREQVMIDLSRCHFGRPSRSSR